MNKLKELDEPILADDYPVHWDYLYVADGNVVVSDIQGTVGELRRYLKATEIRRCDVFGRQRLLKGDQHE